MNPISCHYCGTPLDEEPYLTPSNVLNAMFHPDECNACRRETESDFAGADESRGEERFA